ncbi:hypothetical protein ACFSNO_24045 [Streptomyces cirratus]
MGAHRLGRTRTGTRAGRLHGARRPAPEQIRAIFDAIPPQQLRGVELAEFNAPLDDELSDQAVETILAMVAPAFENVPA